VVITTPVPRRPHRFRDEPATGWRSHTTLGLRRSSTVSGTSPTAECLFARRAFRSFHSEDRAGLDHRSLEPFPLFGGRVRAYLRPDVRLPISATALRRAGKKPELWILAGTKASTFFLFLRATHGLPCGSGDARRAAQRPFDQAPVSVPPAFTGFPDRDTSSNAPPPSACAGGV